MKKIILLIVGSVIGGLVYQVDAFGFVDYKDNTFILNESIVLQGNNRAIDVQQFSVNGPLDIMPSNDLILSVADNQTFTITAEDGQELLSVEAPSGLVTILGSAATTQQELSLHAEGYKIISNTPTQMLTFKNAQGGVAGVSAGNLLVSGNPQDVTKIPANGMYVQGDITSNVGMKANNNQVIALQSWVDANFDKKHEHPYVPASHTHTFASIDHSHNFMEYVDVDFDFFGFSGGFRGTHGTDLTVNQMVWNPPTGTTTFGGPTSGTDLMTDFEVTRNECGHGAYVFGIIANNDRFDVICKDFPKK